MLTTRPRFRYITDKYTVATGHVPLDLFSTKMAHHLRPPEVKGAPDRVVTARNMERLFRDKMFTRFKTVKRAFRIFDEVWYARRGPPQKA